MMKLLFKPTGNIFTLPDEEAIRIKNEDRGNYQIFDAGYQEAEEPVQVEEKTVQELVMQQEERAKEIEQEDAMPEPEKQVPIDNIRAAKVEEDTLDLDKMKKVELVGICRRLNLPANERESNEKLKERIRSTGIIK